MGKALYRKYRSKSLDDIVGQEHITSTLKNALKQGRISHAYLLTGPRGVGKTSIARILAHEINHLPYSEEPHLDIIEIDAASNRRIDEMRDLRDRVQTAPTSAKYKVYIIDEVHMLTKEAFNALLKTLEEPPAHVVFILATTESHKLPDTIISRTQRYSFRPASPEAVVELLKSIATAEKITIDQDALELIAERGDGSFRDSVSLLDQASSVRDHVTRADVEQLLGIASKEQIETLWETFASSDANGIMTQLQELYDAGYEPAMLAVQLGQHIRQGIVQHGIRSHDELRLLQELLGVPSAHNPKQLLDILLLKHTAGATVAAVQTAPRKAATPAPSAKHPDSEPSQPANSARPDPSPKQSEPAEDSKPAPAKTEEPSPTKTAKSNVADDLDELWQEVLQRIKQTHNTLYGIARMAQPSLDGDTLTVQFKFAFHAKRLKEAKNNAVLTKTVEAVRGRPTTVQYVVAAKPDSASSSTKPDISAISNIFGGAELIE